MKKVLLIAVALMMMASMASADWAVEITGNHQGFKLIQSDMLGMSTASPQADVMPGQIHTEVVGGFGEIWWMNDEVVPFPIQFNMWAKAGTGTPTTYTLAVANFGADVGADLPHGPGLPTQFVITVVNDPLGQFLAGAVIGAGNFAEGDLFNFSFANAGWNLDNKLTLAYAVPEPGTMVALGSGLVGLVGFAIRRRK